MNVKKITCKNVRFWEFPDLIFGKSTDNKTLYFNATYYIQKKGNPEKHSVEDFRMKFHHWIVAVKEGYNLEEEEIFIRQATGDILIEESLALLFVAYLDPDFGLYLLERMSEMLLGGITVSDTWLLQTIKLRFTTEELISNLE